ncbi:MULTISPECIES: bifunctional DNA-formamidopyrimidine glycosylase/DNA-(apurinic or apyrimidinic site) lyase [unclassified Legionella]|uniref:bifunctional DNA-formamidopyrimidine glycosylase/DNA-(apurinic or apyrimidinic site) lyase n=1 Tax=unclassified Legionella TaxID=2622702 RepID=UPI0010550BFC|nr:MULTISPECIES: bifunctional DNA-formamidopyrimidine glycosylase/DNA-(apurinic or apyrimidinic site) lyase [unclassified Legionella]MDI9819198.1 bifunctional DNA-formamidopyrimidine glycosylase/DNA-(apurinic or apyrimidinic site) lyase [Legionella sp. PL877]
MPELPEVETTKRGISPYLINSTITAAIVRQPQLRALVTPDLNHLCSGQSVLAVERRAKYLLLQLTQGHLLIHLGMSGHLRLIQGGVAAGKHDHIDLLLGNGYILRYNDPRRFGLWLYCADNPYKHPLLAHLGPEPLSETFNSCYLSQQAYKKKQSIKAFIMRNEIVVGVGNIYATESLFLAGIHPQTPAGSLDQKQCQQLVVRIKQVLRQAIHAGGTTLRDFYAIDGKPGYFVQDLKAYGRKGLPCLQCNSLIQTISIGGRNSAFCPVCQPNNL